MIAWRDRRREGWYLRLDSGEPDPPAVPPAAVACSPAAEAWFRSREGPGLCAWGTGLFLPRRRGQQYCTAACRSAAYRAARR